MIVLVTSLHLMIIVTVGVLVSTIVGPLLGFGKNVGVVASFGGDYADFWFSVNWGTNCNSQPKHNMI